MGRCGGFVQNHVAGKGVVPETVAGAPTVAEHFTPQVSESLKQQVLESPNLYWYSCGI